MSAIVQFLESGKAGWATKAAFAGAGLLLLCLAAWAIREVYVLDHVSPPHHAGPLEFALALVAVVGGSVGTGLVFVGPGLVRQSRRGRAVSGEEAR